jgi:hypothetical protein
MEWNNSFRVIVFMNVCNTQVKVAKINLECVWHTTRNVVRSRRDIDINLLAPELFFLNSSTPCI